MKPSILLVCTGNVCRSPMAAALLAARAERSGENEHLTIASAGTWALEGQPASPHAQTAMMERGLSLEAHRGQLVDRSLIERSSVVLAMTQNQRDSLVAEFPDLRERIHLFSELVGRQYDIADPIGGSLKDYETCAAELSSIIDQGYSRLDEWLAGSLS